MEECKCKPAKSYAERIIEYQEFVSLVKRMRQAQNRVDMLADGEDIEFVDMLCIEQREAEREVDEWLKKMEV